MAAISVADATGQTESVFARRMEVALKMYAGEASYDDVLAFHSDDFVWLSPGGVIEGKDAARTHAAARMSFMPEQAFHGVKTITTHCVGQYAFLLFKTDLIPFGTDTFVIRDGKVVFQSNAVYVPRDLRAQMKAGGLSQ